jgi:hypothetical protein
MRRMVNRVGIRAEGAPSWRRGACTDNCIRSVGSDRRQQPGSKRFCGDGRGGGSDQHAALPPCATLPSPSVRLILLRRRLPELGGVRDGGRRRRPRLREGGHGHPRRAPFVDRITERSVYHVGRRQPRRRASVRSSPGATAPPFKGSAQICNGSV